jgi:DNA-directed RNA polymerase specialized sigma24 family protein
MLGSSFPELLAAAQGGDEQAFAVLWRDLQPALLRYLGVAAPEAAEDLAADTWVSVIRGLGRFRGDGRAFQAWVFTVARHRAIDWRRQATRRRTSLVPVEQLAERPAPDDPVAAVFEAQSPCGCWAAWRWPKWPGLSASVPVQCGSWPIGGCGGWPDGWRRQGWRGV